MLCVRVMCSNQTYTSNQLTELYYYTKTPSTPKHAKILLSTAKHYDIDASSLIIRGYKHDNIITSFNKAILYTDRMNYLIKQEMQTKQLTNQYSQLNTIVIRNTLHKYYVNTGTSLKMILHCEFYGQNLQL